LSNSGKEKDMEETKKRTLEFIAVSYFGLMMDLEDHLDIANTIARDEFPARFLAGMDPVFQQDVLSAFSGKENATRAIDALIEKYKDE
jgi:hypothetical protein